MEVRCGREFYSQQDQMIKWCTENIGPGGWSESRVQIFAGTHRILWVVKCDFGYTTFKFYNDEDGKRFREYWGC